MGGIEDNVSVTIKASAAGNYSSSFSSSDDIVQGRTCYGDVINGECETGWQKPTNGRQTTLSQFNGASNILGIKIEGAIGNNVSLTSDTSISIKKAGYSLNANATYGFSGGDIGNNGVIKAGYDIKASDIGHDSTITTPRNIDVNNVGSGSKVNAGRNIEFNVLEKGAVALADRNISGNTAESGSVVSAGRSIHLVTAYFGAIVQSGRGSLIENTVYDSHPAVNFDNNLPASELR